MRISRTSWCERTRAGCAQGRGAAGTGRGGYLWQGIPLVMQSAR
ncbi:hypothetical protein ASZ90_014615 [hydrocarbon metagenome]|uniref:Uncharacterized protein n=1 Tax=hydrocarbon metagenome TaxID=938273 RepID=A0A0W8F4A2_9ZZZZ